MQWKTEENNVFSAPTKALAFEGVQGHVVLPSAGRPFPTHVCMHYVMKVPHRQLHHLTCSESQTMPAKRLKLHSCIVQHTHMAGLCKYRELPPLPFENYLCINKLNKMSSEGLPCSPHDRDCGCRCGDRPSCTRTVHWLP